MGNTRLDADYYVREWLEYRLHHPRLECFNSKYS